MASRSNQGSFDRRSVLLSGTALVAATFLRRARAGATAAPAAAPAAAGQSGRRPNILFIIGDDIGQTNVSAYSFGVAVVDCKHDN